MADPQFTPFELLLIRSQNELGTSVLLVLAWLAACDGTIDKAEVAKLRVISEASDHGQDLEEILSIAHRRNLDALQLAAEIIVEAFRDKQAELFMEMAIGVAVADGYLLPAENHIVRFLSDLLGLTAQELDTLFSRVTGRPIPRPSDPSSAYWWQARDDAKRTGGERTESATGSTSGRVDDSRRVEALATLGLEEGAAFEEIKAAYRRLVSVHHPDRFAALGKEATAAATATFQRIQSAYDYLTAHA